MNAPLNPQISKKKVRSDIQFLRGICVTLVFLYHSKMYFFDNGYLGVDLFLLISGYFTAQMLSETNPINFLERRFRRLMPPYIVVFTSFTFVAAFIVNFSEFLQVVKQYIFSMTFLSNFSFWSAESYFENSFFTLFLHSWSLSLEAQFYILAAILTLMLKSRMMFLSIILLLSFSFALSVLQVSPKTSFFLLPSRVWEFLAGIILFRIRQQVTLDNALCQIAALFMALLSLAILFIYPFDPNSKNIFIGHPSLGTGLFLLLFSPALIWGFPPTFEKYAFSRGIIWLGNYSYQIYLVHFPLIIFNNYTEFEPIKLGLNNPFDFFLVTAVTIISSFLLVKFLKHLEKINKKPMLFWVIGSIACIALSLSVVKIVEEFSDKQSINIQLSVNDKGYYRCGKLFRFLNPTSEYCMLNDANGDRKALLLGNSHADSLKEQFIEQANKSNVRLLFYVKNDPLFNEPDLEQIIDDIETEQISELIIHYNNGWNSLFWQEQARQLLDYAIIHNLKTAVIMPVPSYEDRIPKTAAVLQSEGLDFWYRDGMLNRLEDNKGILTIKQNYKKTAVKFFDPWEFLCNDGRCRVGKENGKLFYFDGAHLTLTGAKQLTKMIEKVFK